MMHNTTKILLVISFLLAFVQCSEQEDQHAHEEEHGHEHEEIPNDVVELTEVQFQNANIRLDSLQSSYIPQTIKANGHVTLPPNQHATVAPFMGGNITNIHVLPGDEVQKGSVLATLQNPDFIQLQEDYLANRQQLVYWEQNLARQNRLYEDSIGSEKDLQEVTSNYESLKTRVVSQSRKLALLGLSTENLNADNIRSQFYLRAPISGEVQHIKARMGQFAAQKEPVFEIVDKDHVHLDLMVYEDNVTKVRRNQPVMFRMNNKENKPWRQGEIFAIGSKVDDESKGLDVHAHIDQIEEDLIPGLYVDARIMIDSTREKVIPEAGVVNDSEGFTVFKLLQKPDASHDHYQFKRFIIQRSINYEGKVSIRGLSGDDQKGIFVTEGADVLLREYGKSQLGGHAH